MATQIVMDRTGDTRHYLDAMDPQALLKAEERLQRTHLCRLYRGSPHLVWRGGRDANV